MDTTSHAIELAKKAVNILLAWDMVQNGIGELVSILPELVLLFCYLV